MSQPGSPGCAASKYITSSEASCMLYIWPCEHVVCIYIYNYIAYLRLNQSESACNHTITMSQSLEIPSAALDIHVLHHQQALPNVPVLQEGLVWLLRWLIGSISPCCTLHTIQWCRDAWLVNHQKVMRPWASIVLWACILSWVDIIRTRALKSSAWEECFEWNARY